MAKFIIDTPKVDAMEKLETNLHRRVVRDMLYAGGKVLEKEMRQTIEERKHVRSGDMRDSVGAGEISLSLDESSIEVWPQGFDRMGISNEEKMRYIIDGRHHQKKDDFMKKARKRIEPRLQAVMAYQMDLSLKEIIG